MKQAVAPTAAEAIFQSKGQRLMKRVSFAAAAAVFSLAGFVTRVLPVALSASVAFAALLWLLTDKKSDIGVVVICVFVFVVWFVPRMIRFMAAYDAHLEFKEKYGERYQELVESGEIQLGTFHVLFARSPERYSKLLEAGRTN